MQSMQRQIYNVKQLPKEVRQTASLTEIEYENLIFIEYQGDLTWLMDFFICQIRYNSLSCPRRLFTLAKTEGWSKIHGSEPYA